VLRNSPLLLIKFDDSRKYTSNTPNTPTLNYYYSRVMEHERMMSTCNMQHAREHVENPKEEGAMPAPKSSPPPT
jgi:hypothetical protein